MTATKAARYKGEMKGPTHIRPEPEPEPGPGPERITKQKQGAATSVLVGRLASWHCRDSQDIRQRVPVDARRRGRATGRANIGLSTVYMPANAYSIHFGAIDVNLVRQHWVSTIKTVLGCKVV
jgi:hypothetical protein